MKLKIFYCLFLAFLYSTKSAGQLTTFFVTPHQTDTAYSISEDSNYVTINTAITQVNKLLLYIGGTNSSPKRTTEFLKMAANLGYHVISISYPNSISVQSACGASADTNCHINFRQEACYGTPLSSSIAIDTINSIYTRTMRLLQYLAATYPNQNWGQFFLGNSIDWSKVVTAGHSQGAGHALYFASINNVERCIMFSGANDFSYYYNAPPNWISGNFASPKNKIFSLLHLQDEVVPYASQLLVTQALGLWSGGDDSTMVDNLVSPYNNSHLLYTNLTPQSMLLTPYHNSTVVDTWIPLDSLGNPVFIPVWTYLLTYTTSALSEILNNQNVTSFPNPFTNKIYIDDANDNYTYVLFNCNGHVCWAGSHIEQQDFSGLPSGFYLIRVTTLNKRYCFKLIKK